MFVCMNIYFYMYVCLCPGGYICTVHIIILRSTCLYLIAFIHTVHIFMYLPLYLCRYVCIYLCIHAYMYEGFIFEFG